MKKFVFPLQKLLEYKEHIQKNEQDALRLLQTELNRLLLEMEQMRFRYEELKEKLVSSCETGIAVKDLVLLQRYIGELQKKMRLQKKKIEGAAEQVEKQRAVLVEATKEKVSIEKLRDKHLAAYQVQERKEDERFIEEFISNAVSA